MTEAALLAAILDAPEDDAPRLIYSDWLDEQGQCERAEFIKVQCRLAELEAGVKTYPPYIGQAVVTVPPAMPGLRWRERELFERRGTDWLADYFGVFAGVGAKMSRGFVHAITCTAEDLLTHGDKIIAPVPLPEVILPSWQPVEEVTLTTWPNMLAWFPGRRLISCETSLAVFERLAKGRWDRVKKWTLPLRYSNYEIVEERQETQHSRSHDIR